MARAVVAEWCMLQAVYTKGRGVRVRVVIKDRIACGARPDGIVHTTVATGHLSFSALAKAQWGLGERRGGDRGRGGRLIDCHRRYVFTYAIELTEKMHMITMHKTTSRSLTAGSM